MAACHVCGNDISKSSLKCKFCGCKQDGNNLSRNKEFNEKTVNLELGRPVIEVALRRLNETIEDAQKNNVQVLTLIHGYGSSGKGGLIRLECRKSLDFMKSKGRIRDYIAGEDFSRKSGPVKFLLQRYPKLTMNRNLNRGNRGITLVVF